MAQMNYHCNVQSGPTQVAHSYPYQNAQMSVNTNGQSMSSSNPNMMSMQYQQQYQHQQAMNAQQMRSQYALQQQQYQMQMQQVAQYQQQQQHLIQYRQLQQQRQRQMNYQQQLHQQQQQQQQQRQDQQCQQQMQQRQNQQCRGQNQQIKQQIQQNNQRTFAQMPSQRLSPHGHMTNPNAHGNVHCTPHRQHPEQYGCGASMTSSNSTACRQGQPPQQSGGSSTECEFPMPSPSLSDSSNGSSQGISPAVSATVDTVAMTTAGGKRAGTFKSTRPRRGGHGRNNRDIVRPSESTALTKLTGALRWIIYNDHIDDYAEMLCKTEYVRLFVINQCAKHSSSHSACIKWSKKWNLVNHPECANAVYCVMSQQSKLKKKAAAKGKQNKNGQKAGKLKKNASVHIEGYHNLPKCSMDVSAKVLFVNDAATFEEARDVLMAEKDCIGLDLECMIKEFPIENAPKYCQVLQIATSCKTVVFDLEAIPSKYAPQKKGAIDAEQFDNLLHDLLYNASLLKIGMAFDGDIKCLGKQYPYFKSFKCIVKSYFELEHLLKYLRTAEGMASFGLDAPTEDKIRDALKKTNAKREGGLATVVRHVLGKRLNKKEQLSNWGHRPLRLSQLEYAAIDSAIEVEVYRQLVEMHPLLIRKQGWISDLCRF